VYRGATRPLTCGVEGEVLSAEPLKDSRNLGKKVQGGEFSSGNDNVSRTVYIALKEGRKGRGMVSSEKSGGKGDVLTLGC